MTNRTRWVIGNWKMNGTLASNAVLLEEILTHPVGRAQRAVCVPFPYLTQCQRMLGGTDVQYGSQDVSEHHGGAFTGQVSADMLREFGASLALVGHSERRLYNRETSANVAAKALASLSCGLTTVICVGESLAERDAGDAETTVAAQLEPCAGVIAKFTGSVVIAYEPVWAIGTGKTASPAEAQSMHAYIRSRLTKINDAAGKVSIIYGGSVKAVNAGELFAQPDIDGGLIGGASLVASEFLGIVSAV